MPPPTLTPLRSIHNVPPEPAPTPTPPPKHQHISSPLRSPPLTHPHIHLDKAFIHNTTTYSHLLPQTGTFAEALTTTSTAKRHFTPADLLRRGTWLLAGSVSAGVTAMRAFVEIDQTVNLTCLDAGITLKETWKDACTVQLVAFAQDAIFSGPDGGDANRRLMEEAVRRPQVDVLGTTPYVEDSLEAAERNVEWAVEMALECGMHLDFHLDYHLDGGREAMVWFVLRTLRDRGWTRRSGGKRVVLGHCTRLTMFGEEEWGRLAREVREGELPVSFVGLPTSDLYMAASLDGDRPRGTLRVLEMIEKYGLDAVMGVNNVGNSFTPWGSEDPLALACLGVGIYQAGTQADAELLYECVSTRARAAIGLSPPGTGTGNGLALKEGDRADILLFYDVDDTGCGVSRPRHGVAGIVWDPPSRLGRDVVAGGRLKGSSSSLCPRSAYSFV
ncbi:Metallo-dependent hydrolase [Aspergillus heteromorphus CBS 117.55]|uniref:Metallo-dependent hydrolase n=1 Tax=Aspergillus heteromorphus CBS 117.55 TaxID=1448321 RepID=A0A317VRV0_9EURO|nr:Metallo-dependent hydrolase [Aspergillus heteromorphus CBS 117.55]PWY76299.1 Metallo-dependent hydrolase [Aspergillus heteromorphus CBS 117.55]